MKPAVDIRPVVAKCAGCHGSIRGAARDHVTNRMLEADRFKEIGQKPYCMACVENQERTVARWNEDIRSDKGLVKK